MGGYILSVDLGTTTVKAGLVDPRTLDVAALETAESPVEYPKPGWSIQDPAGLWSLIAGLSRRLAEEAGSHGVEGVVFSTYLAGVVLMDEEGGELTPLITWLDERAHGLPREAFSGPIRIAGYNAFRLLEFLRLAGGAPSRTGKDPISKIAWLAENEPDTYRSARFIGNMKSWLLLKTTGTHATSPDEAHLTWLADTRGGRARWSERLLKRYRISREKLPTIMDSTSVAGKLREPAASELGLEEGVPVVVGAGDIASAAVGSGAVADGEYHVYIGTSDWLGVHSPKRLLDVGHYIGSLLSAKPGSYLVIAEQEIGGALLDWILRVTGSDYSILEEASEVPPGSGGLLMAPWLYGERCPIDDPNARGVLVGFSTTHDKAHLARAALEAVAFNIAWALEPMERLVGPAESMRAVGGGFKSRLWARIVASATGKALEVTEDPQLAGIRGAAAIAVSALEGSSLEEVAARVRVAETVRPDPRESRIYRRLGALYRKLYSRLKPVFAELASTTSGGLEGL